MTPQEQETLSKALSEVGDDLPLIVSAVKAIKAKDKTALAALVPKIVSEAKEDYAAIKPAIPMFKTGYKTTEFWLIVIFGALNIWYLQKTGKSIPIDANAAIASLIGVYTVIRGLVKKTETATTPEATPAVVTTNATAK